MTTTLSILVGLATYYAPGVIDQVAANRGMELTGYVGGVALNHPTHLGQTVWLLWPDEGLVDGPFLVVDCAAADDVAKRERLGYVVEVDAGLAERRGFYGVGPRWVIVVKERPTVRAIY